MNLGQARTELKARGLSFLADARANQFLDDASQEIEEYASWPWLETTATGAAPLAISDMRDVLYVVDTTTQVELENADVRDLIDSDPAQTSTGSPVAYWLDNLTVKTWPSSTDNLSVRYLKVAPALSVDSDTPLFPTRYHSLWVTLAQCRVLDQDENASSTAAQLRQQASQDLQSMAVTLLNRMLDSPPSQVVHGDPDSSLFRGGW